MNFIKQDHGYTLIGVLAAVSILSIVVFSFSNLSSYTRKAEIVYDRHTQASLLAEEQLSNYRTNGLPTNPYSVTSDPYTIKIQKTALSESPNYDPVIEKNQLSLQAVVLESNIPKLLTVTVSWED